MTTGLKIANVRKTYGKTEVLRDIDIEIAPGEFLILVGPSGCGKSTLLNMIAGLETVTEGHIFIGDREVTGLTPKDRDIAMVFQSYALYPNMSVRKNIAFGLEMRKIPKAEQEKIVARVASMLQIEPLLDRKPSQLSGGQRQRVAMGRALAREPAIFLFDEPLSNLDAKLRVEMRTEIKVLHQRTDTTIVYVTHDQIEAMTLGDRIAVMHQGEIQQFGSPRDIYDNPTNLFVAGFIGSPSMNFIPCTLVESAGRVGVELASDDRRQFLAIPDPNGALRAQAGRAVTLGIRPEQITHVMPGQQAKHAPQIIACVVNITEPTGPDTLIITHVNDQKVVCRSHPDEAAGPGEVMEMMFDTSKAVLFDPKGGNRIA